MLARSVFQLPALIEKKQFGKPLLIGLCRLEIGAVTIWANVLNCDQGPLITYASFVVIHIYNMIV